MLASVLVAVLLLSVVDAYALASTSTWVAPPLRSSSRSTGIYPRRCLFRCRAQLSSTTAGSSPPGGSDGGFSAETVAKPPLKVIRGRAGPADRTPAYDDTGLLDRVLLGLFRSKLAEEVGGDGDAFEPGYDGLMKMIRVLNEKHPSKRRTQEASRRVLKSLFPSWLPARFAVMFSKPFPAFSSRMNAWVTLVASQWLMGPSELNDVEIDGGTIGIGHGLKVERCRFLEAAGCASVCMNTCKARGKRKGRRCVPTEEFFAKDMGLALEMTPNYDDFSCQFSFNKTPLPRDVDEVFRVACFEQCPSRGALRQQDQPRVARCHQIDIEEDST
ncbi:unnamed protein product [Scytosiphon promiscuus]